MHGWQDNCGSFDPLIQLLPDKRPVLAIDYPGHGYSSHLPKGQIYHAINYLPLVRRIQRYYKWDQVSLMSHSQGAIINFLFSATFPENVDFIINFDVVKGFVFEDHYRNLGINIDWFLSSVSRDTKDNIQYTEEELKEKWISSLNKSLTPDSVSILMKRGVKYNKETGKYVLRRDPRLKVHNLHEWNTELLETLASNIKCHFLVFKFNKSQIFDLNLCDSPKFLDILRKSTKSFQFHVVDGTHHAHMNSPELVAPHIIKFLEHI